METIEGLQFGVFSEKLDATHWIIWGFFCKLRKFLKLASQPEKTELCL